MLTAIMSASTAQDIGHQQAAATLVRMQALAMYIPSRQDCYSYEANLDLELAIKDRFADNLSAVMAARPAYGDVLTELQQAYQDQSCQILFDRENQAVQTTFGLPILIEEIETHHP